MEGGVEGDIWHGHALEKNQLKFKRVLLKLSGEALMGEHSFGISPEVIVRISKEIVDAVRVGAEIGIVVGGGNIFRGVAGSKLGMDRVRADHIGMLATVMNALALQDALLSLGVETRVLSAIDIGNVCEPFVRKRALKHLDKGRVVIFAAGTGNPFFTTDTAAALRALEINAHCLLKGTKVDGVYDRDPEKYPNAKKFDRLTYHEVIEKGLRVMDHAAISLAMDAKLPVLVFSIKEHGNICRALSGKANATLVTME